MVDGKRFFVYSFCILLQTSSILTFYFKSRLREDYLNSSDVYSDITDDRVHHLVKRGTSAVKCYQSTFGTKAIPKNTVEECVAHCWYERCVAALIKQGNMCKCLPEMSDGQQVDSGQCSMPCSRNKQQNCGGLTAYAAYMTGYVPEPFVRRSFRYYPRNVLRENLGCFIPPETVSSKALTIESLRMTIMLCSYLCYEEKHNFAGLFKNDGCFCFWGMEGFTPTSKSKCSVPCAGHRRVICGSTGDEMNVFKTLGNFPKNAGTGTDEYQLPAWIAPPSQMINGGGRRKNGGRRNGGSRRNNAGRRKGAASHQRNPRRNRERQKGNNPSISGIKIRKKPSKQKQTAHRRGNGINGNRPQRRKVRRNGRRRRKRRRKGRRRGSRRRNRQRNRNGISNTRNGNTQRNDDYGNNDDYNSEDSNDDYNEENIAKSKKTKGRKSSQKKEEDETEGGGFLGLFSRGASLTGCTCKIILNIVSCCILFKYIMSL